MSQITRNSLTEPAFFALIASREGRCKLIDGEPVMMAPTTQRHANIVANILADLLEDGCLDRRSDDPVPRPGRRPWAA